MSKINKNTTFLRSQSVCGFDFLFDFSYENNAIPFDEMSFDFQAQ